MEGTAARRAYHGSTLERSTKAHASGNAGRQLGNGVAYVSRERADHQHKAREQHRRQLKAEALAGARWLHDHA